MEATAPSGRVVRLTPELIEQCIRETAEKPDAVVKKHTINNTATRSMMTAMSREGHRDSASWESDWITRQLRSDKYELILDYPQRTRDACQAIDCLIENLSERHGARIHPSCGFVLRLNANIHSRDTRCYHVHCFGGIVDDPARFVKPLQIPTRLKRAYLDLPLALYDWMASGGYVYELDKYKDITFAKANQTWREQWCKWIGKWSAAVASRNPA